MVMASNQPHPDEDQRSDPSGCATNPDDHAHETVLLEEDECAISFRSGFKHYGRGKGKTPVLIGLDMNVNRGQIYGLLGPSGCGKTTLLKCIVGTLKLDSGSVLVFGEPPGLESSTAVPGHRVGYMPQELALFGEFNITETLIYFARVFGMSADKFKERLDFLMTFLDLPSRTRKLSDMSGGQQRRASLAVALLHEPDLLILDEPTVGVDPLLRTSIWSHLLDLSGQGRNGALKGLATTVRTTIVITTHYIEEARQAHRVGMMRFGKLLAEGQPDELLQRYKGRSLEEVFLGLCIKDGQVDTTECRRTSGCTGQGQVSAKSGQHHSPEESLPINGDCQSRQPEAPFKCSSSPSAHVFRHGRRPRFGKVRACMLKTFTRMKKRWGFLIYQFVLPALQVSLFCLAIGQDPKDLALAVVNAEQDGAPCSGPSFSARCPVNFSSFGIPYANEHLSNFTCRYLSFVDPSVAELHYFGNETEAVRSVEDGHAWGVIITDPLFSQRLYQRIFDSITNSDLKSVDTALMQQSSIKVRLDVTNQHIAFTLQLKLVEAFDAFMTQLVTSCGLPKELASIPLMFEEPIYGSHALTFTDFMAPGIILTIVHSMALGYSAMIIIMERNEGMMDRTWVAGVTSGEFALAHFLVSLVVNLLQVITTLAFMILVFQVPAEGSMMWIFLLTMLQGIAGTTIGLIISALCRTQQDATQIALGIFYPNLILSGIIWPIESMPTGLRYFSYILPQTFACEAMRGILLRGWGLDYLPVWRGFAVTAAWIVATYAIFKRLV